MRTRAEAVILAKFLLNEGLDNLVVKKLMPDFITTKQHQWHFGYTELRALLDYIYESKPQNDAECLNKQTNISK